MTDSSRDARVLAQMQTSARKTKFYRSLELKPDGCIEWTKARGDSGYGVFRIGFEGDTFTCTAHRVAWMLRHGTAVPDGLEIDHRCRNRACCNADHLEAVTHRENVARSYGRSIDLMSNPVRSGSRSVHARGNRFVVTWRDYFAERAPIQRGRNFPTRELAEAFAKAA